MANTIDWVVGSIIAIIGLFIFYRALKEPMDLLFGVIGKGLSKIRDLITGGTQESVEVIRYG